MWVHRAEPPAARCRLPVEPSAHELAAPAVALVYTQGAPASLPKATP
jgi:hypothetical protein